MRLIMPLRANRLTPSRLKLSRFAAPRRRGKRRRKKVFRFNPWSSESRLLRLAWVQFMADIDYKVITNK